MNPTHGSTLPPKKYLAWSRLACMLRLRCLPPSPPSAPSSRLSTLYVPVTRLPRGEMQAVPCGACSNTRLLPASTSQPPPAGIRSFRKYNTGICLSVQVKTVHTFGHVQLPRKRKINTGSTTPTDAFAPASTSGRPRGGRAQAGLPLSAPMPTHPRRDPGPKLPSAARPQTPH